MYIVGYHIFINLLVNHIKNNSVKYRQFVLIFTLVNTAMLFSFFFCAVNIIFFVQQYIIEDYSPKKMDNKQEQKSITKLIKTNCKKDRISIIEIFLKMRKLKKRKDASDAIRCRLRNKKEYMKNYFYKIISFVKSFN